MKLTWKEWGAMDEIEREFWLAAYNGLYGPPKDGKK